VSFINQIKVCPNNKYVITGGATEDRTLKFWDFRSGTLVKDLGKIHQQNISCIKITSNSKYMFTASEDYTMKKFCIKTKKLMYDFGKVSTSWIDCLDLSEGDKYIYMSNRHGVLKVWEVKSGRLLKNCGVVQNGRIISLALSYIKKRDLIKERRRLNSLKIN